MDKKTVLVTGSSRGIGAHLAAGFARAGYGVVINYSRSEQDAAGLYDSLAREVGGESLLCIRADVGNRADVDRMFDRVHDSFGRLDVLVNNAGINIDRPFLEMNLDEWDRVMNTILTGAFNCSQEFARRYRGDGGHIVNIGAVTAISGRKNGVNYCSARAGILNFTRCLALELAPAIRVNTVTPGYIATDEVMERRALHVKENYYNAVGRIPAARLGTPEDIFRAILFLVGESSYITGQNIIVDGGYLMR